jgi:hypothetical protein
MEQIFLIGWSALLTAFVAVIGFIAREKNEKLKDLETKVNNSRVEVARDNVTKAEIEKLERYIDQRFNKFEEKIDLLFQKG